jgi:hypothetical protein
MHRPRPAPDELAIKLGQIDRQIDRLARRRKSRKRSAFQMSAIRIAELNRLFAARHGSTLPDDEAGRECVWIAANHLILLPGVPSVRLFEWAKLHAPWLTTAELEQLLADAASKTQIWTADGLAWRLKLTYADRQALKIKTIGSIDVNKRERAKLRKAAARAREKRRRDAKKAPACAA